jgi:hypothetical protein
MVTLTMTLLFAAPAFANVFGDDNAVANLGGFVAIDSTFETTTTDNSTDESITLGEGALFIVA